MCHLIAPLDILSDGRALRKIRRCPRKEIGLTLSSHDSATLQRISIHTDQSWAAQRRHNHLLTERLARSEATLEATFAFLFNKIEESSATKRELTRALGEFRVTQLKPAIDQEAMTSAETTRTLLEDRAMRPRIRSSSEVRMQTFQPLRKCFQGCPCVCHKFRQVKLPSMISALFGSGSFRYRGLPIWRTYCNYRPCKRGVGPSIVVNYFLPTWLSRKLLHAWFTSAPLCPPEFLIRTYQAVSHDHVLVSAVVERDLQTLQNAFATGKFSPYVLQEVNGDSLLHVG